MPEKNKLIAAITTALFFGSLFVVFVLKQSNGNLSDLLKQNQIQSEHLLSEKLILDKNLASTKKQLSDSELKRTKLEQDLEAANARLLAIQKQVKSGSGGSSKKLQQEIAALKKTKAELESQLNTLRMELASAQSRINELVARSGELEKENQLLADNLKMFNQVVANNYRIETTKGKKEKLTVQARKANKIKLAIDVPKEIARSINFKLIAPDGKEITSEDRSLSWNVLNDEDELYASLDETLGEMKMVKRVELTYSPKTKLNKGVYQIELSNNGTPLGKCQFKLK